LLYLIKFYIYIISKSDFEHFLGGATLYQSDRLLRENRLKREKAEEIMTTRMGKVESTDRINVALEIFNLNRFHALPVVDNDELVGIITTYDILKALSAELPKDPTSVYDKQDTL
jgi:acetoin utilization protein AcuB